MDVRTTLRAEVDSAAAARRFVADVLWQRGFPRPGIEEAVLLTSEAVTNAVLHAGTDVGLVVIADAGQARIEVYDGHATPPVHRSRGPEDEAGMGLHLIDAIAEAWGVQQSDTGKCVWFEVRA